MSTAVLPDKCRRKQRYMREEAEHMAQKFALSGDKMSSYECEYCGHWHVGHSLSKPFGVAVDAYLPKSKDEAEAERRQLQLDMTALRNSILRLDSERSPDGWYRMSADMKRRLGIKQERSLYLKKWLADYHAANYGKSPKRPSAGRSHEGLTDDLAMFYTAVKDRLADDHELWKLFRKCFGVVCAVRESPQEASAQLNLFLEHVGGWAENRIG